MFRYVHTNIIAKDSNRLIQFYKEVLNCKSIGETRDLKGEWLDKMTGIKNAHITGEHLCMPGYNEDHPTLEIFSYDEMIEKEKSYVNQCGFAHLAFEVDDVKETLSKVITAGGGQISELVTTEYKDGRKAIFVYATDLEGNIIELQSWSKTKSKKIISIRTKDIISIRTEKIISIRTEKIISIRTKKIISIRIKDIISIRIKDRTVYN